MGCATECLVPRRDLPARSGTRSRWLSRSDPFLGPINVKRQLIKLKQSLFCAYICMPLIRDRDDSFHRSSPAQVSKEKENRKKKRRLINGIRDCAAIYIPILAPITKSVCVCSKSYAGFASLFFLFCFAAFIIIVSSCFPLSKHWLTSAWLRWSKRERQRFSHDQILLFFDNLLFLC